MIILGFSSYIFDSAACLIKDGEIIAACQEERFTREKNTGVFPKMAIQFCLDEANIEISDVDHIAFYWNPLLGLKERAIQIFKNLPYSLNFYSSHSSKWFSMYNAKTEFKTHFPGEHKFVFHNVEHHISHAASSFFVSPYKKSNILVMDGSGEITATSLAIGEEENIEIISRVNFPHSLGYLYVSLTHYLGFQPDSDEYKVMALASMGEHSKYYNKFCEIITIKPDGLYEFDLSYFNYQKGVRSPWVSKRFINEFGPISVKGDRLTGRHYNIAWALQKRLEDVAIHCANYLYRKNPSKNLILAGGCALNCVMNEKILKDTSYENVWLMSAPHDAGTSIGAAFWVYNHKLKFKRNFEFKSPFLGPEFSNTNIKLILENSKYNFIELSDIDLIKETAKILSNGKIIGWFQGKTEFGPRALGNRSILADPRTVYMKNLVNSKIKHREEFRPFAPAILEEKVLEYFEGGRCLPFMTFVLKAKDNMVDKIQAVVHFDGTSRVQTVSEKINPRFYSLIKEFENITQVPVLLNTSFNDSGEPIVNSPQDALLNFEKTNLDYLVIGNYIMKK